MFAVGAAHQQLSAGVVRLHAHRLGAIHQYPVGNDLGLQAGVAELPRHILGGLAVFGSRGQVRLGGQSLQVPAGQLGVGHGEELLFNFGLGGEISVAEDGGLHRLRSLLR